eukprot:Gb_29964 [translate_table: standard]
MFTCGNPSPSYLRALYQKTFGDDAKRDRFLRWRIQLLEKGIQQLSFRAGGVNSMVQTTDHKNSPGAGKRGLQQATKQALAILQDNYPEFVARKPVQGPHHEE